MSAGAAIGALLCLSLALQTAGCAPSTQRSSEPYAFVEVVSLLVYAEAESGQCVQSVRVSDELGRLTCAAVPQIACEITRKADPTGTSIVPTETRDRYLQLWANLVDDFPTCDQSAIAAAAQPVARATPEEDQPERRENASFQVVSSCAVTENESLDQLLTRGERDYVFSARGVLAGQALTLLEDGDILGLDEAEQDNARSCYEQTSTADERELLEAVRNGDRVTETACFYGQTAASPFGPDPECTDAEKELAEPFDFGTPLSFVP